MGLGEDLKTAKFLVTSRVITAEQPILQVVLKYLIGSSTEMKKKNILLLVLHL